MQIKTQSESELLIRSVLRQMGLRPQYKGYQLLADAVGLYLQYGEGKCKYTALYHHVALRNNITPAACERSMRVAVNSMYPASDCSMFVRDHTVSGVITMAAEYTLMCINAGVKDAASLYLDNNTHQKVFCKNSAEKEIGTSTEDNSRENEETVKNTE